MRLSKTDQMLTLLFDADMLLFETTALCEKEIEWEPNLWTLHSDAGEVQTIIDDRVQRITEHVLDLTKHVGPYELLMCFTDDENYRKKLLPTYKANRIGKRKPLAYKGVKEWMTEHYTTYIRPTLEADDCLGILAGLKKNTVIISGDKDMQSVPGRFYNHRKGTLCNVTEEEADYWHLYQTLIGDAADNYKGCPGVGPVAAEKILKAAKEPGELWSLVVAQFKKKGLTEADALLQARVARILRKADYDFKKKEVKLWQPKSAQ